MKSTHHRSLAPCGRRGVSLVEMLLTSMVLGMILFPLTWYMQRSVRSQQIVATRNDLLLEARRIMDDIMNAVSASQGIVYVDNFGFTLGYADGSTVRYYLDAGVPPNLTLKKDVKTPSGNVTTTVLTTRMIVPPQPFRFFRFKVDGSNFTFEPLTGQNRNLADRIQIELVLTSGDQTVSLRSSAYFRNKP